MKGSVKFFNDKKGFGFIGVEGQEEDIFVHYSAIEGKGFKKLLQNDNVEFEIVEENGKKRASKVRVIES